MTNENMTTSATTENNEYLVALDVETTGLDANSHELLEISAYVLEPQYPFNMLDNKGFHAVIKHDPETVKAKANDFVVDMHNKTGLWDKVADGEDLVSVDNALYAYLEQFMNKREGRVMGNSVRLDMNFLDAHLPKTAGYLHYRFLDVSGVSWFAHENFGVPYYEKDASVAHTADGDIIECIKELKHVHEHLQVKN